MTNCTFVELILNWYKTTGRHNLPWQKSPTPYSVLISEVMLQQTQVKTVIPYFERWMEVFPTVEVLAASSEDDVMRVWQGLGYYSRARNLRKAAQYVVEECDGTFPVEHDELLKIPSVGRYTAGAIRSFAYNTYGPIVDGNVKRLFSRYFGIEGDTTKAAFNKAVWDKAEEYTPKKHNRDFAQGLLDLGATVCTPTKNPKCSSCPLIEGCVAHDTERVHLLPQPKIKKALPTIQGHFLWIEENGLVLLEKRSSDSVWKGLWCLPQIEDVPVNAHLKGSFKHVFSHYKLRASVWSTTSFTKNSAHRTLIDESSLNDVGLPTPVRRFIEDNI